MSKKNETAKERLARMQREKEEAEARAKASEKEGSSLVSQLTHETSGEPDFTEIARKLEKLEITVSAPTTDGKKLYGAVSVSDILAAIEANRGIKVERRQLELDDALREVGVYEPSIDFGHGVKVKFKITILDEAAPAET